MGRGSSRNRGSSRGRGSSSCWGSNGVKGSMVEYSVVEVGLVVGVRDV